MEGPLMEGNKRPMESVGQPILGMYVMKCGGGG